MSVLVGKFVSIEEAFRIRFESLTKYPAWTEYERRFHDIVERAGRGDIADFYNDYHRLFQLAVLTAHGLGEPIGPRRCCHCCGTILLDEDGDGYDMPMVWCSNCAKAIWMRDFIEERERDAERMRQRQMSLVDREAEHAARVDQITMKIAKTVHGLMGDKNAT